MTGGTWAARRRKDAAPGLLHNIGGPPRATISWRGMGRGPIGAASGSPGSTGRSAGAGTSTGAAAAAANSPRGTWLQLSISIGQRDARYRRDWNTAGALLELVEPDHGLSEHEAQHRLVAFIEEETARSPWPACLLAGFSSRYTAQPSDLCVELDHVPTAFVALAKCTGSLWLRDRRPHLAPLHAPTLVEPGSTPMRGVRWGQALWFPQGIPQELLSRLGTPKPAGRTA
jgi:hypothetical protein